MQIRYYLIKYALICIMFERKNLIMGLSQVKNSFSLLLTILDGKKLQRDLWISTFVSFKSENTVNSLKKIDFRHVFEDIML